MSETMTLEQMLKAAGFAETTPIPWPSERWLAPSSPLASHKVARKVLGELADAASDQGILRSHVTEVASTPIELLVASMAWGFGDRGYGPSRTAKMLATAGAEGLAAEMVDTARSEGAGPGFGSLFKPSGSGRIFGLSVAMGTKLIYFACRGEEGSAVDPRPLVYDQFVRAGFDRLPRDALPRLPDGGKLPRPNRRVSRVAYLAWCEWARDKAPKGFTVDDVENALFQAGKAS